MSTKLYRCEPCAFSSSKLSHYGNHCASVKHQTGSNPETFYCDTCEFITNKASNFASHCASRKHQASNMKLAGAGLGAVAGGLTCALCARVYQSRKGLWSHAKQCGSEPGAQLAAQLNTLELKDLIVNVVKSQADSQRQNQEFQKQMLDVVKGNHTVVNTNSHNKTFNLQFFLNEECKHAMNISEFVDSFNLQLTDLESVGRLGYVDGLSKIITKRLQAMDVHLRPIHCSDAKREILHVKDNDVWARESADNPRLRHAIQALAKQNRRLLLTWRDAYPDSWQINNSYNDHYMILINQAMGGKGTQEENEARMIKQIAKEVVIHK